MNQLHQIAAKYGLSIIFRAGIEQDTDILKQVTAPQFLAEFPKFERDDEGMIARGRMLEYFLKVTNAHLIVENTQKFLEQQDLLMFQQLPDSAKKTIKIISNQTAGIEIFKEETFLYLINRLKKKMPLEEKERFDKFIIGKMEKTIQLKTRFNPGIREKHITIGTHQYLEEMTEEIQQSPVLEKFQKEAAALIEKEFKKTREARNEAT